MLFTVENPYLNMEAALFYKALLLVNITDRNITITRKLNTVY